MNKDQLDVIMEKLQSMFAKTIMADKGVPDQFYEIIDKELGPNYFYYADWDTEWLNDDWVYDIQGQIEAGYTITAVGEYEMGLHEDRVIVVCYK